MMRKRRKKVRVKPQSLFPVSTLSHSHCQNSFYFWKHRWPKEKSIRQIVDTSNFDSKQTTRKLFALPLNHFPHLEGAESPPTTSFLLAVEFPALRRESTQNSHSNKHQILITTEGRKKTTTYPDRISVSIPR
jgi:hypothetical protein